MNFSIPSPSLPSRKFNLLKPMKNIVGNLGGQLVLKDQQKLKSGIVFMAERIYLPPMDAEVWKPTLYLVAFANGL